MALRDKLAQRVQPFLEPGEEARHVVLAQTGPHPLMILLLYVFAFWMRYRIIVVTDRAVVILRASVLRPAAPKELLQRLPRQTPLGAPLSGLFARTEIAGEKTYIHKRFHKDVAAADAELAPAA